MRPWTWRRLAALAVLCVAILAIETNAVAQLRVPGSQPAPEQVDSERVRSLIDTLEDDAQRKRFVEQLRALLAARTATEEKPPPLGTRMVRAISQEVKGLSQRFAASARVIADIPTAITSLQDELSDPKTRERWLRGLSIVAAVFIGALLVGLFVYGLLGRPRQALQLRYSASPSTRASILLFRTVLDAIPIAAFGAAGYIALSITEAEAVARLLTVALLNAVIVTQVLLVVTRATVAPHASNLRLLPIGDEDANYAYVWARRFIVIAVYGYFTAETWLAAGLPRGGHDVLRTVTGVAVAALAVILILQIREPVARLIRGEREGVEGAAVSTVRRRLSDFWHLLVILYVAIVFVVWELQFQDGFALVARGTAVSLISVYVAVLVVRGIDRLIQRGLGVSAELELRFPGLEARANRYFHLLGAAQRILIALIAFIVALEAWNLDSFGALNSEFGQRAIGAVFTIGLLIVLCVVAGELASAAIQRYLAKVSEGSDAVSTRAKTLLPILRNAILVVLVSVFVMILFSEFGLDIGPLLAGAGVIGIAIGFGAQTLFKDFITGVFILTEDQIAVGDVIRTGGHAGIVEGLTIRTIRLRDLSGVVHVIPFGEVRTLENLTKDYSRYLLEVGVAYREDPDEVIAVLVEIGEELQKDPHYGPLMIEPIEILGVDRFADSAIIIRARLTTQPIKQWEVGREFNRRMKKVFDERGIEIPFPHPTSYFGEDKYGEAPVAHVRVAEDLGPTKAPPVQPTAETESRPRFRSQRKGSGSSDESD